jgi:hypothetical protein
MSKDNTTIISLEDLYKEYRRVVVAIQDNELSVEHSQGALAYLELKAKDSNIIFIAPELNHAAKNYMPLEGIPKELYNNDTESSESDWNNSEEVSDIFPTEEELAPVEENKAEETLPKA